MKSFLAKPKGDATFLSRVTKCLTTAALSLATLLITGSAWAA